MLGDFAPMRFAHVAGIAVTAAVVMGVDLAVPWATLLGVFAGALTIFLVSLAEESKRL
jgi:hypothetical protein